MVRPANGSRDLASVSTSVAVYSPYAYSFFLLRLVFILLQDQRIKVYRDK